MGNIFKYIVRFFAFFSKEFNEIRRQPRLVLSLILGPFLILLLFGVGYRGTRAPVRVALVVQPDSISDAQIQDLEQAFSHTIQIVSVGSDETDALKKLYADQVDMVEIFPAGLEERVMQGEQSPIDFRYDVINPVYEEYLRYVGYAQVNELNQIILLQATGKMQTGAKATSQTLQKVDQELAQVDKGISQVQKQDLQKDIRFAKNSLALLALNPLLVARAGNGNNQDVTDMRQQLQNDLDTLDKAIDQGTLEQQQDRIKATRDRISILQKATNTVSQLSPAALIAPLRQEYQNVRGQSLALMIFYAPAVLALILQHIGITLGALSLVREKLLGALELFGVAPISMIQVLVGKYMGYTLFIGIITAVLILLMPLLGVPFLGNVWVFIGFVALFILASLGAGFLISAVSTSDSQAVQLSMLVLLLSIFFSGFFLPLESFWTPVRILSDILPLTHAISGFQTMMLRGNSPGIPAWGFLTAIAALTFWGVVIIWGRQFRQIA
ncbi:MAG: ABC transporter permease [Chloroflexi bacterium]|nr:ABC transporter permease [Chloroflexota bacterium]